MNLRIVKIASFYKPFLNYYYAKNSNIIDKGYSEQYHHLMQQGNAWSNFFQLHFNNLGHHFTEIIHNATFLQKKWAEENNITTLNSFDIVFSQIKAAQPDVVFFQDTLFFDNHFYRKIKDEIKSVKLIFGHCCSPYSRSNIEGFKEFDFMLACSPGFKMAFEKQGIKSYLFYHAFEHTLIDKIKTDNNYPEYSLLFIGSFVKTNTKEFHDERLRLIESILAQKIPITLYAQIENPNRFETFLQKGAFVLAKSFEKLKLSKVNNMVIPLRKSVSLNEMPTKPHFSKAFLQNLINEPLYGLEMFKATFRAKASLNVHGGIAGNFAANMRMFEVTGAGSLLITDHKKNIKDLFIPDKEIITYKSIDECIEKIKWVNKNPEIAKEIAIAGQKRTLKDHTLENRANLLSELIIKHLKQGK